MCVCRINKTRNYTVMSNYHLQDKRLTMQAKGLLSFMLSLPDDWDYTVNGLAYFSNDGVWRVTNTLNELKKFGYLIVTKLTPDKTKSGRIEYVYDIFEESQIKDNITEKKSKRKRVKSRKSSSVASSTRRGFSSLEKTSLENCAQQNTNIPNTNKTKYEEKKEVTEVSAINIKNENKEKNNKEKKETLSLNSKEKEEVKNISTDTKKIASGLSTDKTKFTMNAYDSDNHIINAEEKSRGCEKKILVEEKNIAKETVNATTEERSIDIKKEDKELEIVAKTVVKELDNQVKTAKKREVKPATDEEIKQSETIVNELNKCIRKQSKKDISLSNTQKSINAIVHWLREGFKIKDFVSIINLKVKTWMGNPMAVQLKPSVLFSVNNFREYLEETKLEQLTNPIYAPKRKRENKFANFEQRTWDFDKIERMARGEYDDE